MVAELNARPFGRVQFHIDPRNPRADCTISAARFTSVPACSCMPSNDVLWARDGCLEASGVSADLRDSAEGDGGLGDGSVEADGDLPVLGDVAAEDEAGS